MAGTLIEAGVVREIERGSAHGQVFRALAELAQAAGSNRLVALDLVTRVTTGEIVPPTTFAALWGIAVQRASGKVRSDVQCPRCRELGAGCEAAEDG